MKTSKRFNTVEFLMVSGAHGVKRVREKMLIDGMKF